ncbi:hypothetical protein V7S43_010201 [Phytophthora oleae]|uniref:Uncharacterized protein n=1 Tax=Phytophthora oleae TaxID=2107226 RepID=A0ABD3FFG8_9STRA
MKCAFVDCVNPELPTLYPCSVCEHEVHHVCSNDLFDQDNIACPVFPPGRRRLDITSTNAEPTVFEVVGWAPGSSRRQRASQDSASTVTEPEEVSSSQSSVESSSELRPRVDAYGIPVEIHHYRQLGKRNSVWDVAHVLSTPYAIGSNDDVLTFGASERHGVLESTKALQVRGRLSVVP